MPLFSKPTRYILAAPDVDPMDPNLSTSHGGGNKYWIVLGVLMLASLICSTTFILASGNPGATPTASITPTPTQTATATASRTPTRTYTPTWTPWPSMTPLPIYRDVTRQVQVTKLAPFAVTKIVYVERTVVKIITATPGPTQTPWIIYPTQGPSQTPWIVSATPGPTQTPWIVTATYTETPTQTPTVTLTPDPSATPDPDSAPTSTETLPAPPPP